MARKLSRISKGKAPDLGVIQSLYDRGQFRKAMFQAQNALKTLPESVGLHALAGFSAQKLGETAVADSLLTKAVELAGTVDEASLNLPQALAQIGRWSMALPMFVSFLKTNPTHAAALHGLGRCLLKTGEVDKAIVLLGDALKYGPDQAEYAVTLGEAFGESGQEVLALQCYEIAHQLAPSDLEILLNCAKTAYDLGQLEKAEAFLLAGLGQQPDNAAFLSNYATILYALGRIDEAIEKWRLGMDLHPGYSISYSNFANKKRTDEIEDFGSRLDAQLRRKLPKADEMHFRLAKVDVLEAQGDYEAAYEELLRANALRLDGSAWHMDQTETLFAHIKTLFSEQVSVSCQPEHASVTPIFILGMPRSGTSLTEAILGRHSDVKQRGELGYLAQLVNQMGLLKQTMTSDQAAQLAQAYMARLTQTGASPFITDKMPDNYRLVGYIAMAMPNARIVHVQRDPRACCWSNFRQYFSSDLLEYSYDPETVVRQFELYQDLMQFWHNRFPGRIIDVDYETLVENPDQHIPELVERLGLGWQEACLTPQKSLNAVRTASQDQVRKKIYKGSAQGWLKYEAQAGGWLSRLPEHQPIHGQ